MQHEQSNPEKYPRTMGLFDVLTARCQQRWVNVWSSSVTAIVDKAVKCIAIASISNSHETTSANAVEQFTCERNAYFSAHFFDDRSPCFITSTPHRLLKLTSCSSLLSKSAYAAAMFECKYALISFVSCFLLWTLPWAPSGGRNLKSPTLFSSIKIRVLNRSLLELL